MQFQPLTTNQFRTIIEIWAVKIYVIQIFETPRTKKLQKLYE